LISKIEKKFESIKQAFNFFDITNHGSVSHNEFKIGIHKLGLRLSPVQAKKLFQNISTCSKTDKIKMNSSIKEMYFDFFDLEKYIKESKKEEVSMDKGIKRRKSEQRTISLRKEKLNDLNNINQSINNEDEIISTSLASFKKKSLLKLNKYSSVI